MSCIWLSMPVLAQEKQQVLSGFVLELKSDVPMAFVQITNLNSGTQVETQREGQFSIPAAANDLLQFDYPGYRTDTLVVIEFDLKRVYLTPDEESIRLDAVSIEALTDSQLETEIDKAQKEGQFTETSISRGGIRLSPSRLFGQSGRQARERYDLLVAEKTRRQIDNRFSVSAIQALTPLKGDDLEVFMVKFRPDPEFALNTSEENFKLYIMDSYAAFKKLTPEEKQAILLKSRN